MCWEALEDSLKVEYKTAQKPHWQPALYCSICTQVLVDSQFSRYVEGVTTTTCEKELNRLVSAGPPMYLSDQNGFPCDAGDHLTHLRYGGATELSARLKDSLEGEERQKLWDHHKTFTVKRDHPGEKEED